LLLDPGDSPDDPFDDDNHGTAVLGEIVADNDVKGVTGISWGADIRLAPVNTTVSKDHLLVGRQSGAACESPRRDRQASGNFGR